MAVKKAVTSDVETLETYTKEQVLSSEIYESKKDVLSIILREEQQYSLKEVDELIEKFMKGKVK